LTLIRTAQDAVWNEFGIWLTPEVQLIGQWEPRDHASLAGPAQRGPA
jgi:hypothetical protein